MTGTWFVDTNVLVYDRDTSEPVKQPHATSWLTRLWHQNCARTSVQVLNEFFYTVTRSLSPGLQAEEAWRGVRELFAWRPLSLNERLLRRAWQVRDRYGVNWWDCLVFAAAQLQACDYVLSEDFQDGQDIGGVVVVNPFAHVPDDFT